MRDPKEKSDRRRELFATTPPLETLQPLLTLAHRDGLSVLMMGVNRRSSTAGCSREMDGIMIRRRRMLKRSALGRGSTENEL